jgi:D-alanyl-D-alanine dipeptidase
MKQISHEDLLPLNLFSGKYPICIDLVYAKATHLDNNFVGLYHPSATMLWMHKDLVPILLLSSVICSHSLRWVIKVNDCLRPVEAQAKMAEYGYNPMLVAPPGAGAHPRAMAVDIEPMSEDGELVDMGTPFDSFTRDLAYNPAAREFTDFKAHSAQEILDIRANRAALETAMRIAADAFYQTILPLPQEWWDFRFIERKQPSGARGMFWNDYSPLSEASLPPYMRLVGEPTPPPAAVVGQWEVQAAEIDADVRRRAEALRVL